jgi:hypothetical protein
MRHIFWILTLLFTLIGPASAFPLLPAEFSGTVTIDGSPRRQGPSSPPGFDGRDCGSLTLTEAGAFGGTSTFDKRLLVSGEDGDAGKTITFLVDGLSTGTAVYTPGTSTNLALAVAKGRETFLPQVRGQSRSPGRSGAVPMARPLTRQSRSRLRSPLTSGSVPGSGSVSSSSGTTVKPARGNPSLRRFIQRPTRSPQRSRTSLWLRSLSRPCRWRLWEPVRWQLAQMRDPRLPGSRQQRPPRRGPGCRCYGSLALASSRSWSG